MDALRPHGCVEYANPDGSVCPPSPSNFRTPLLRLFALTGALCVLGGDACLSCVEGGDACSLMSFWHVCQVVTRVCGV